MVGMEDKIYTDKRFKSELYLKYLNYKGHLLWLLSGSPCPMSSFAKARVVREYAKKFGIRIFIETGTYMGDMVAANLKTFDEITSVELDGRLCEFSKARFARYPHVRILRGDSSDLLPELLEGVDKPALFWLDAHYSGGLTSRNCADTPVAQELKAIFSHGVKQHVVLIDDAREFGAGDYPSLSEVEMLNQTLNPYSVLCVRDDIIRIYKTKDMNDRLQEISNIENITGTKINYRPRSGGR